MKRYLYYIILTALVLVSCSREKSYRIGVSQCSTDDWRQKMNEEIMREALLHPELEIEIRSADDSNEKQIADLRYFCDNNFDLILVAPNEADAMTPVIKEIHDGGMPVIIFDRDIHGDSYDAFIGADNEEIGRKVAMYASHQTGGKGKILEVYGRIGSTPATQRHVGFIEQLRETPDLRLVATGIGDWDFEEAKQVVDSLLFLNPDADVIYAHNDRMAIAAAEVARAHGIDPCIIGVDAAPEIGIRAVADSIIDATFLYPTEGHRLVRTALDILEGREFETVQILPSATMVDLGNAEILLQQNEALKEETSKIQFLKGQVDEYWSRHSVQTTLFYAAVIILILVFVLLGVLLRAYWIRKKHQNELMHQNRLLQEQKEVQEELNRQLTEATRSKLTFFTNVSHDLRTPLTLIAEPVDQLYSASNLTPSQHSLMEIAYKNVRILNRLINQILDFRKHESGRLELNVTEVNPAVLMADWTDGFQAVAHKRDIKLMFKADDDVRDLTMALDQEKIERVFFNLLSNAFKFTPANGRITVNLKREADRFIFSVTDTGQGISAEDQQNIFERFFQADKVHPGGSGIGLSLCKAFVEMHRGTISVDSEPGKGTVMTVSLPITHTDNTAVIQRFITDETINAELAPLTTSAEDTDGDRPLVLVIDDNPDMRQMVEQILNSRYRIITAADGREGLAMASKYVPDLIVCDMMMPGMDGLECCRELKHEMSTSHIPVLMLTACAMDNQRAEGYLSGADGYISKPFNTRVLLARIKSLIDNRRLIRDLWQRPVRGNETMAAKPELAEAKKDSENEFYARFLALVETHMSNPDLNVDMLAGELGLGRSQFYRKLKALTNYSPVELLRRIRLNTARDLLTTTSQSISEIAYGVGFSAPAYFTKCYREAFGETPTELRDRLGKS